MNATTAEPTFEQRVETVAEIIRKDYKRLGSPAEPMSAEAALAEARRRFTPEAGLPPGWTDEKIDRLTRADYESRYGRSTRPMSDEAWLEKYAREWSIVSLSREAVIEQIESGDFDSDRTKQRRDDIALLTELRQSLPTGHTELPGVIRAIELLRVTPLTGQSS